MQRRRFLSLMGVAAAAAVAPVLPDFSGASTSDASDWEAAIPQVYLSGQPVYGHSTLLPSRIRWQAVVTRVYLGGTYFATFSSPDGRTFALSEDDGTVWRVQNPSDNLTWQLATTEDVNVDDWAWLNAIVWIIEHLVAIAVGIMIAIAILMIILVVTTFLGDKGRPRRRNQIDLGMKPGGQGLQDYYGGYREVRERFVEHGVLTQALSDRGLIIVP